VIGIRSYLFVPGDAPDKVAKASQRGADAVIIDLEDAVPVTRKEAARTQVAEWIRSAAESTPIWVRVNNTPELLAADIVATVTHRVEGLLVPKVLDAANAAAAADSIAAAEATAGLSANSVAMVPMIETAGAVLDVAAIAGSRRVHTVMVGEYDLAAELSLEVSDDDRELAHIRAATVVACSAAGVRSPIAPVSANFTDLDAFRASTVALRRMGYWGRAVIHPAQIPVVNDVFTPSAGEVAKAQRVLEIYEAALAEGKGVCVGDDGRLIDEAIVRGSRRVLEAAKIARSS
jgi:citrate lyase subunit beta/citryl-CoA lyase